MVKETAIDREKALERWGDSAHDIREESVKTCVDIASKRRTPLWVVIRSDNQFDGF